MNERRGDNMYRHILIATDGTELAARGVEHGLALAVPLDAKVTVLTVTEPLRPEAARLAISGGVDDPVVLYDQQIDADMKKRFSLIKQQASDHGIVVDLLHEIDEFPAEAIVRTAELRGCDLIVMSSHGRRGAARILLGSQTADVLAHTTIPVLVVR
jgi:nucleotide-binding universal stress UspA family protein